MRSVQRIFWVGGGRTVADTDVSQDYSVEDTTFLPPQKRFGLLTPRRKILFSSIRNRDPIDVSGVEAD